MTTIQDLAAVLAPADKNKEELREFILSGGYPSVSLNAVMSSRQTWFNSYRTTYVERDVREIRAVENLADFGRLMVLASARTGQIANLAELGRTTGISYATLRRYLQVLEQTYQLYFVSPWHANVGKRLTKAPKLYWTDTGMAGALQGIDSWAELEKLHRAGSWVETWVASELRKAMTLSDSPVGLHTWRIEQGSEIDFLLNRGTKLIALEVKSGASVDPGTVASFRTLKKDLGDDLGLGVILYAGQEIIPFEPWLAAVPTDRFFGGQHP